MLMRNPIEKVASESLTRLCDQAILASKDFEFNSFSVQTLFDKKTLATEDDFFDAIPIEDCMATKNIINSNASKYIFEKIKKPQSAFADIFFNLNFKQQIGSVQSSNLCIFGHYIKKSRQYCQHPWPCTACNGRGCKKCDFKKEVYPSIENSLKSAVAPAFCASDAKLHACGREDVDVMTLGSGRPFVIELKSPKKRSANLNALATQISNNFPLEVIGLTHCPQFWIEAMCTSHFDKHYRAIVSCEKRKLGESDFDIISKTLPLTIRQLTPTRVLRRRADLARIRTVHSISLVGCENGSLTLDIWAQAGTYIKELIHGDNGRTIPSISSILGDSCACAQLDVMGVDDSFVKTLRKT